MMPTGEMMRRIVLLYAALVLTGCATIPQTRPPVVTPPVIEVPTISVLTIEVVGPKVATVTVAEVDRQRAWTTRLDSSTIVEEFPYGSTVRVFASADGYVPSEPVRVVLDSPHPFIKITLAQLPNTGRTGVVRLSGHALADDGGEWNALGTTLFWALWGERHDPDKLERNLAYAASKHVDYIRILSMVGAFSWENRVIDPAWPDYWQVVDRLLARLKRHGIRVQLTVFADAQVMMPSATARDAWADLWTARVNRNPEQFIVVEAANEAWQNGFKDDIAGLARITKRLNDATRVLVAPSAPSCGSMAEGDETDWARELANGQIDANEVVRRRDCAKEWATLSAVADVMTPHFDRDISKSDGYDRPVRQPWEMLFSPRSVGVEGWVNNEPIGPQSSVAEDGDPRRLAMGAAVTWLASGAAYTLHTGAGIRGGSQFDLDRGRSANLWEVPLIDDIFAEIEKVRSVLPKGLANCRPENAHWPGALFSVPEDAVVRAYQTLCSDGSFVALPIGIRGGSATLTARRPLTVNGLDINIGGTLVVPAPSGVVVGKVR